MVWGLDPDDRGRVVWSTRVGAGGLLGGAGAPQMETAAEDSGAFTYHDYDRGTTLVWLSYPAENEFAENQPTSTIQ